MAAMSGAGPTANPSRSPGPRILEKDLQIVTVRSSLELRAGQVPEAPEALAVEAKVAVGLVLEDEDVAPRAIADELQPAGQAHRPAARVLEIGDGVDELDGPALGLHGGDRLPDPVDDEPLLVHGHGGELRPAGLDGDQRAAEGRPFADDDVPGVDDRPGEQVDGVGRPVGDDELVVRRRPASPSYRSDLALEEVVALARRRTGGRPSPSVSTTSLNSPASRSLGKDSGLGRPPASEIIPSTPLVAFSISRMNETPIDRVVRDRISSGNAMREPPWFRGPIITEFRPVPRAAGRAPGPETARM